MSRISWFNLYKKNAYEMFIGGYKASSIYVSRQLCLFVFVAHTVLLPITLTLGAGIKALLEVRGRRKVTPEEIQETAAKVAQLEKEPSKIEQLVTYLRQYKNPKSPESQSLYRNFSTLDSGYRSILAGETSFKKLKLQEDQIKNNPQRQAIEVDQVTLDSEHQKSLNKFIAEEKVKCSKAKAKQQRDEIISYLNNEWNEGTHTQGMIIRFFKNPQPVEITPNPESHFIPLR